MPDERFLKLAEQFGKDVAIAIFIDILTPEEMATLKVTDILEAYEYADSETRGKIALYIRQHFVFSDALIVFEKGSIGLRRSAEEVICARGTFEDLRRAFVGMSVHELKDRNNSLYELKKFLQARLIKLAGIGTDAGVNAGKELSFDDMLFAYITFKSHTVLKHLPHTCTTILEAKNVLNITKNALNECRVLKEMGEKEDSLSEVVQIHEEAFQKLRQLAFAQS
ncbi:MAG: hypothetical protein WC663_00510 [Patescibacteria group bacterium]|jgi:hypothetical protein